MASPGTVQRLLASALRLQPGEGRKTALMFGILMCAVGSFIISRVARDSLFLSRYSLDTLPFLYIWVAAGVSLQSYLFSHVADRFRRDRTLQATLVGSALVLLTSRGVLYVSGDWFYPVLYVVVELIGSLLVIQVWTLANDVFTAREAKRLFGLVGAGGVLSSVVVGFTIKGASRWIATEDMLYLGAVVLLGGLALASRLSRVCRDELLSAVAAPRRDMRMRMALGTDWRRILGSKHLIMVAGLVVMFAFVMTVSDYLFKVTAKGSHLAEADLAAFFGLFYGLTGIGSLLVQLLVTGRMLERFGILVALLMLPGALLVGSAAWLIIPGLVAASMLKGADTMLRYTVNDATMQLLYLPVPVYQRGKAKAFVDGIIRPVSIGLAGVGLAWVIPAMTPGSLGWLLVACLVTWMALAFGARQEYLSSLVTSLRKHRLDLDEDINPVQDQTATQVLRRALDDEDEESVLHALDILPHTRRRDWSEDLMRLLKHPAVAVRARALRLLGEMGSLQHGPLVAACLREEDPRVLAAAIEAYCAIGRERAVRAIAQFLEHPELEVRAASVIGLVRYGGLDGVMSAAERLKRFLDSPQAEERSLGARILGDIQVKNFYLPLLPLMTDADPRVRLSAIRAAGVLKAPELIPALVYRLEQRDTRSAAADALVAIGEPALRVLARVLANPREVPGTRLAIPSILGRIGEQAGQDGLVAVLEDPDEALRTRVHDALHRFRLRRPHLRLEPGRVRAALRAEIALLYHLAALAADLDLTQDPLRSSVGPEAPLLEDALVHRRQRALRRMFRLLTCLYPVRAVDAAYANLSAASRRTRAHALELLDNLLEPEHKRLVLPLLDEAQAGRRRENGVELFQLKPRTAGERLQELLAQGDAWLRVCAAAEVGRRLSRELTADVQALSSAPAALVRETSLATLCQLLSPEALRPAAARLLADPVPRVRDFAAFITRSAGAV
ncbi:MAG TPA: Npt1/Npt2 family nucleotide transporter [Myxococcota bacterium]|nr:Npt1/Npt2 family nucleotide transporter [Myxococcota bacterium]HRY96460.1 Npt1/Npt2 family nucleotide transporter [Myxococcota bacterium]